jgi:hypothetical protein
MAGQDFVREIPVDFSNAESRDVLATLWARTRVDDLMSQDFNGAQRGDMKPEVKQSIIKLGLDYRLMTQFTSFVAVEEMIVTDGGKPRRVDVPVEIPEGVNRTAVFGEELSLVSGTLLPMRRRSRWLPASKVRVLGPARVAVMAPVRAVIAGLRKRPKRHQLSQPPAKSRMWTRQGHLENSRRLTRNVPTSGRRCILRSWR